MGSWESTESHSSPHREACRPARLSHLGNGLWAAWGQTQWGEAGRAFSRGRQGCRDGGRAGGAAPGADFPAIQPGALTRLSIQQRREPTDPPCAPSKHDGHQDPRAEPRPSSGSMFTGRKPAGSGTCLQASPRPLREQWLSKPRLRGGPRSWGRMAFLDSSQPARARRHTAGDPEAPALSLLPQQTSAASGSVWDSRAWPGY